jgi:hypothetical protein
VHLLVLLILKWHCSLCCELNFSLLRPVYTAFYCKWCVEEYLAKIITCIHLRWFMTTHWIPYLLTWFPSSAYFVVLWNFRFATQNALPTVLRPSNSSFDTGEEREICVCKMHVVWEVTPYRLVNLYRSFGGAFCLDETYLCCEDRGIGTLRNIRVEPWQSCHVHSYRSLLALMAQSK